MSRLCNLYYNLLYQTVFWPRVDTRHLTRKLVINTYFFLYYHVLKVPYYAHVQVHTSIIHGYLKCLQASMLKKNTILLVLFIAAAPLFMLIPRTQLQCLSL